MIEHLEWFERKFDFESIPLWMYPNIIERLRGTPARCADIVRGLDHDVLTRRDGDAWSIQENVGHLLDLEQLAIDRLDDFERGSKDLTPADLENKKTHQAAHNDADLDGIVGEFRGVRAGIVQRFEALPDDRVGEPAFHPRLKTPMRPIDLAFFFAEHDDHHLATIASLKRKFA